MTTTAAYKRILMDLSQGELNDIEKKIIGVLIEHPEGRTRQQLVMDVHGVAARPNINNDTRDRKNREAIASLFDKGVPIISNSGEAGYRLDLDESAIVPMINEWRSRIEELQNKVRAGEQMIVNLAAAKKRALESVPPADLAAAQLRML